MKTSLLAAVILLPLIGGAAFAILYVLYPGKTLPLFAGFTAFTLLECVLLACLAVSVLKQGSRKD